MTQAGRPLDRRTRRRLESVEEILKVSMEVMAEAGVGGLSLGEVARRMGLRPPSLYQYFPSKNAVYDELFARGWRDLNAHMDAYDLDRDAFTTVQRARELLTEGASAFARWAVEHPVPAQLMFWRPVPGYAPSPSAFTPAVECLDRIRVVLRRVVDAGWLRPEAADDEGVHAYTTLMSGVISQHLSNEPRATFEQGRFTALVPLVTAMYFDHYATREEQR